MKSSKSYWQVRLQDKIYEENYKALNQQLKKIYRKAGQQVNIQLTDLYMDILSAGEEVTANMMYQDNRYKKLQDLINKEVMKLGKVEEKEVTKSLLSSYKQVYQQTMLGYGIDPTAWTIIDENMAKQIVYADFKGTDFSKRIWSNKSKLRGQLEKSIIESVVVGNSKDRAVKDMQTRIGVGFNDADRIIRTETQRVLNDGQRQTYKDRGYTKVRWLIADDDRLCEECEEMDGTVFDIGDAPGVVHPNCRCTFIPIMDEDLFK